MNGTENYLFRLKTTMHTALASSFMLFLAVSAVSFTLSYFISGNLNTGSFIIACDLSGGIVSACLNVIRSQTPCAVLLLIMYMSAFSSLSRPISAILCSWRGLCLGSAITLISKNKVGGIGTGWKTAVFLYLAATIAIISFASVTSLYSRAITYTFSSDERRYCRSLSAEYTKCFLFFSGAVFILGCASAVFI